MKGGGSGGIKHPLWANFRPALYNLTGLPDTQKFRIHKTRD